MIYTNKHNIVAPIAKALQADDQSGRDDGRGILRVTRMIDSPRIRQLLARHADKIETDVSDNLWLLMGKGIHKIIEGHGSTPEMYVEASVDGVTVGGTADEFTDGALHDYKVTSVWSFLLGDKIEWENQLNAYAQLLRMNGHEVKSAQINAILRDWSASAYERDKYRYPACPFVMRKIKLWPESQAMAYLKERVALHKQAADLSDNDLPDCTAQERWERGETWAVMKVGRKSAVKVCDTEADAVEYMNGMTGDKRDLSIQYRRGTANRCAKYCPCRNICNMQITHIGGF